MTKKDEELVYYRIKITRIREKIGTRTICEYKDKLYCVDCKDFLGHGIAFCEPTLKQAFKTLMKELYLI